MITILDDDKSIKNVSTRANKHDLKLDDFINFIRSMEKNAVNESNKEKFKKIKEVFELVSAGKLSGTTLQKKREHSIYTDFKGGIVITPHSNNDHFEEVLNFLSEMHKITKKLINVIKLFADPIIRDFEVFYFETSQTKATKSLKKLEVKIQNFVENIKEYSELMNSLGITCNNGSISIPVDPDLGPEESKNRFEALNQNLMMKLGYQNINWNSPEP